MKFLQQLFEGVKPYWPMVAIIAAIIIVMFAVRYLAGRSKASSPGYPFRRQLIIMLLSLAGLILVIIVTPISDTSKGQLLNLIGILLSVAIALSSTTFLGNIMAGFMLRAVRNFRPGDFIRVGDHFGRVSERGLFHVEIQTEDSDLTTLPNLFLVTNPVKVIRSSGTFITAEVSLGYDIHWTKIEKLLLEAAKESELEGPFVHILKLGDFSVTYRIAGLLTDIKHLLSARSRLKAMILDHFHKAGVEIVSPTFMNTRALAETRQFIPGDELHKVHVETAITAPQPEKVVFDKAEQAESLENLRETSSKLLNEIDNLTEQREHESDKVKKEQLQAQLQQLEARRQWILGLIEKREKDNEKD